MISLENILHFSNSSSFTVLFVSSIVVILFLLFLNQRKNGQLRKASALLSQLHEEKAGVEIVQSRMADILENTSDLVSMSTMEKKLIYMNQSGKKLLKMDENVSLNSLEIKNVHPRWAYEVIQHIGIPEAIEKGIWEGETALLNYSGQEIPVSQVIISHHRPDGKIDYLSTIMRDISPRKKAEIERMERIRYFENMDQIEKVISSELDIEIVMPDVLKTITEIFSSDRAWLIHPCDPKAENWHVSMIHTRPGYEQPELLNRLIPVTVEIAEIMKLLLESDKPVCLNNQSPSFLENFEKYYGIKSMMLQVLHVKSGAPWILGLHQCGYDRPWNTFEQGLFSKISERITDSMSVLLILRELRNSEDRFRTMMETAPYPIIMADQSGNITFLNNSFTKILGYTIADIPDVETWWANAYPDEGYRNRIISIYNKEMEIAATSGMPFGPKEFDVTTKDGKVKTIEFRIVLAGTNVLGILNDNSERKLAQQMLIRHEKMNTVGGLAAGMAHEINNPLGIILQGIQNTLRRLSPEVERNHIAANETDTTIEAVNRYIKKQNIIQYLEGIQQAGIRASRIVSSMLQFSRKNSSSKKEVDINRLIDRTIEMAGSDYDMKKQYDFKKISVSRDYQQNIPLFHCIEHEIEQVVFNLLKNSAQAMHELKNSNSDFVPELTIKTAYVDSSCSISITDNGPGIQEKITQRIFEPFFTTKDVGDGTGLGLSVSYFIITNNHNGNIEVDSKPGKETTFSITLPAGQVHENNS